MVHDARPRLLQWTRLIRRLSPASGRGASCRLRKEVCPRVTTHKTRACVFPESSSRAQRPPPELKDRETSLHESRLLPVPKRQQVAELAVLECFRNTFQP